ncbi:sodium/hydrogen exchanger 7-like isoform X2 [Mercurialis annua]|uniref:sodium/hydrogen exchanger 7-like isoform X2 n=1 Tax=Mercurialis annua TaxID=3986 RepID=UPI00215E74E5|nr:sodium/hydrogen exchanger 7-like isoform X2 [Mercurialis annua]
MMAIVVYQLFYRMVLGESSNGGMIVRFLAQASLGAVGIGVAFGIGSVLWHGYIFNDTVIEIALTLAVSYIAYFTAQEGANASGVLAVMTLGMFYAAAARTAFKGDGQQSLHHFWEMVAYIANTIIFILSGVVIAEGVLNNADIFHNHGNSWGYLFLLYVFVQISRFIAVGVLFPFLQYFGYGLDWKEATVLTWAGLRGAVALSLSLSVKRTSDNSMYISSDTGTLFVFFTGGIVFLTLIVNGSTTQFILHLLDMEKVSAAKKRILDYTEYEMLKKALTAFGELGDDEELGPADWHTVKKYIPSLNNLEGEHERPAEFEEVLDTTNLKDIRIRLLNGVQSAYWGMLDEGRITQMNANLLMQSVDEAIDMASLEPLCDWRGLKDNVHFPSYYRFLHASIVPGKLVTDFIVWRLESACYVCAAFLRAHRIARQQLHDFIGHSEGASIVISESEAEGEEAKGFLEDVRATFPEVLSIVKTRQTTYSVLNRLSDYLQNLEMVGLLEKREMLHLRDSVQTDLKRLLRNPPRVKIPKMTDLIKIHPLLGALPSTIREPLEGSSKGTMKSRGAPLYKEGSKPNGVWLISNGVVKWRSNSKMNKHSLHPTLTHGSTLGIYEVLVGKPYLCDMITDSIVVCFFIDSDKILSALKSDPTVEDFMWQESSIILAKILLPQMFEKVSMQDMRALVAESSTMNTYIRGETIEVPLHSVGFLLEGFVKVHGFQEELITSPAALLPPHRNQSFNAQGTQNIQNEEITGARTASFSHSKSFYQVETRARVIIFDIAVLEADITLQRKSSPFVSHTGDHPHRYGSRDHALMSWPENFYKKKSHEQNSNNRQAKSLSARAMQLSIYGSMVDVQGRAGASSSGIQVDRLNSVSFSIKDASFDGRPLLSVKSEGNATIKNIQVRNVTWKVPTPPKLTTATNEEVHVLDHSSDESGAEDEHIVRIDSPNSLSFQHTS